MMAKLHSRSAMMMSPRLEKDGMTEVMHENAWA